MTSIREKQLFRSCFSNLGDERTLSKRMPLQSVLGLEIENDRFT